MMNAPVRLALPLLLAAGLPVLAEETAAPAAGEEPPTDPAVLEVLLNISGLEYKAEVTPEEGAGADLRLSRVDGDTMADQGYLVPELGLAACKETGFRFDGSKPATLAADGSWSVEGGCI